MIDHMQSLDAMNPYGSNILINGLGPIRGPEAVLMQLTELPPAPPNLTGVPNHIRLHHLMAVRDFHLPSLVEGQLFRTIDLMVRQQCKYLNPSRPATWAMVNGERQDPKRPGAPPAAAVGEGISGTGKTDGTIRCLNIFPQTIDHETFPYVVGPLKQLVWLSCEVPSSGRAEDMATALMIAHKRATGTERFDYLLGKDKFDGMKALAEWQQVARASFLAVLHLDEISNLFKLSALRQRKGTTKKIELGVVEDRLLKWILSLTNGQIAMLCTGTPDGVGALMKRLGTLQRSLTFGYHEFRQFTAADLPLLKQFLETLGRYQYVDKRLEIDEAFVVAILAMTAGIKRVIIAVWVAAHRVAFDRAGDDLTMKDFQVASATWLAPIAPAIAALLSQDPNRMANYEDLVSGNSSFWSRFWIDLTGQR